MRTVVIHGPQGCGKSEVVLNELCKFYGCEGVRGIDQEWLNGTIYIEPGHLNVTDMSPEHWGIAGVYDGSTTFNFRPAYQKKAVMVEIISFDEAMKTLREKIVVRHLGTTTWQGPANEATEFLSAQEDVTFKPTSTRGMAVTQAQMERLAFLIEECGEAMLAATKIMRFGFDSYHPDDPTRETNRHRLFREMTDVMASYDILVRAGDIHYHVPKITAARERKLSRARFQGEAA